jgi:hypothetical protein
MVACQAYIPRGSFLTGGCAAKKLFWYNAVIHGFALTEISDLLETHGTTHKSTFS